MELKNIKMKDIVANPKQPRKIFDEEKLKELADSIKEGELLQPIVVRKKGNKKEIVVGERRHRAFEINKADEIPAIVWEVKDDIDALEKSLVENLQRENLTSVERENAIGSLWDSGRYKSYYALDRKLGYKEGTVQPTIDARDKRKSLATSDSISTRTFADTRGLSDEPRKKILKAVEEKKIKADDVRDIVKEIKKFKEPKIQEEMLDLYENKAEHDNKLFKEIVKEAEEIEDGERKGTWTVEKSVGIKRFEKIKEMCKNIMWLSPAKIKMIGNKGLEKEVMENLKGARKHIDTLLRIFGEEVTINAKNNERIEE